MTALARLLTDALKSAGGPVESTTDAAQTAHDLLSIGERVALQLAAQRTGPAEPVHVRIGNRPSDLGALLGIWNAGAVAVPLHVSAAPATVASLTRATGARLLVDGDRVEAIGDAPPAERPLLRDAALVIFTSGSTGLPKGVVIGHQRLADKIAVLDRLLQFNSRDAVLVPLQLTFIFGMWVCLLTLRAGAKPILVPRFSIEALSGGLARGATILAGVPSMYRALLAEASFTMPGLRQILTGGEVLPKPLALAMQQAAPDAALYDLYGLIETGSCDFVVGPADQPDGLGTIGATTEGVSFRIATADGREAAPDEGGELCIRTPYGMLGYLDNPQLTAQSFHDGYFNTGDLARIGSGGRVQLIGRSKDIVSRGGMKIAPLEIDNLLAEHPGVIAALCAGVPDERLGECIHAVVVPRAGAHLTAELLRAWMLERTEKFKVPDAFHFTQALPVGPTGKADRRGVAKLIGEAGLVASQ
ncbi:MAG: long-chain fatty acid--CoA ligase [Xanthobacteraceae bacterium]|nr:long-chain fatty acid--CoA ligase [Xanthobacteraceae bacterium]